MFDVILFIFEAIFLISSFLMLLSGILRVDLIIEPSFDFFDKIRRKIKN